MTAKPVTKKLKALELENQNLQLKLSELTKEIELLQQKISNDAQESATKKKDAKEEGQESREELMDTILDLEEEVDDLSECCQVQLRYGIVPDSETETKKRGDCQSDKERKGIFDTNREDRRRIPKEGT